MGEIRYEYKTLHADAEAFLGVPPQVLAGARSAGLLPSDGLASEAEARRAVEEYLASPVGDQPETPPEPEPDPDNEGGMP